MVDKIFGKQDEINPKNSKIKNWIQQLKFSITLTPVGLYVNYMTCLGLNSNYFQTNKQLTHLWRKGWKWNNPGLNQESQNWCHSSHSMNQTVLPCSGNTDWTVCLEALVCHLLAHTSKQPAVSSSLSKRSLCQQRMIHAQPPSGA